MFFSNGTKLSYKALPKKKKVIVYKCCSGYYETRLETCEGKIVMNFQATSLVYHSV